MRSLVVVLGLLIFLCSCSGSSSDWATHNSKAGGFSVQMPAPVANLKKNEVTPFGKQDRHFVRWKPSSFSISRFKLFEVSYITCPAYVSADSMAMARVLDSAIELRKNDFSDVDMIESQAIELNGYPGRAFFYDAPKGNTLVSVKICIAGNKLYDLVAIVKKDYSTNTEVANFFNSFKLID